MTVSRRNLLKASSLLAAAFGLRAIGDDEAVAAEKGGGLIWLQCQGCSGCSMSLLNSLTSGTSEELLRHKIDLKFHSTLMAAGGANAVAAAVPAADGFVLVVEGAVPAAAGGQFCYLWSGTTAWDGVREFARRARCIVAVGTCAAYGGIPASRPPHTINPTGARGLSAVVDGKLLPLDSNQITESVVSARYAGEGPALAPAASATRPDLDKSKAYSWIKAPRYQARVFEVGPLARMWIAGHYRKGISVVDRLTARALEAERLAAAMAEWLRELQVESPTRARVEHHSTGNGFALTEAPRGALGHWTAFSKGSITRYQIITPTTWNASPADESGQKGPLEQALIGTAVRDRAQPIELLRVVHSFDPCLACSVH